MALTSRASVTGNIPICFLNQVRQTLNNKARSVSQFIAKSNFYVMQGFTLHDNFKSETKIHHFETVQEHFPTSSKRFCSKSLGTSAISPFVSRF